MLDLEGNRGTLDITRALSPSFSFYCHRAYCIAEKSKEVAIRVYEAMI